MRLRTLLLAAFTLAVAAAAAPASAQLFRAYISPTGSDANNCTLPAPCRLLPAALNAVANGGEIWMLDSANYNTATVDITKSVSILAVPGAVGSVVSGGGTPGIRVAVGALKVALRNLVVVPLTGGANIGIDIRAASTVTIEECVVANQADRGINVQDGAVVAIARCTIRDNGTGVFVSGAQAHIASASLFHNTTGVNTQGSPAFVGASTVSDSTIFGGTTGVICSAFSTNARMSVTRSTIQQAGDAMTVAAGPLLNAIITLSGSTVTNNTNSWKVDTSGGGFEQVRTLGNNHFADNAGALGVLTGVVPQ